MAAGRILVIGGTGLVGQPVARQLQQDGFQVRIYTRNPAAVQQQLGRGFEYVTGTLEDEASLTRALKECSGVHISLPSGHSPAELEQVQHQGTARIARLAKQQRIQHLTYVSGYLVSERFAYIPAERAKLNAEQAIERSGVPYTIFRPTYFTDTLPRFVRGTSASIFGKQPHPIHFLALSDFAQMVSAAQRQAPTNCSLFVCGPEALTFEQALTLYVEQVAPGVKVTHTPFAVMKLMNRLLIKGLLTEALQLLEATDRVGEIGDPAEAN